MNGFSDAPSHANPSSLSLDDLLERVKAATGPDQFLGFSILAATNPHKSGPYASWDAAAHAFGWDHRVTSSLDAALALVERVLPGWGWEVGSVGYGRAGYEALLTQPATSGYVEAWANTPALALLAALLSALQAQPNRHDARDGSSLKPNPGEGE